MNELRDRLVSEVDRLLNRLGRFLTSEEVADLRALRQAVLNSDVVVEAILAERQP